MFAAILKFLKGAGKQILKTFTTKEGLREVGKGILKKTIGATPAGQLYDAFRSATAPKPGTANIEGMGEVPTAPADYYKSPQAQITPTPMGGATSVGGMGMGGAGQGILSFLGQSGVGENKGQEIQAQQRPVPIPAQYQQFIRQPGMQFDRMALANSGELPLPSIPQQYQNMAQADQQPTFNPNDPNQQVGAIRGIIDALTGQPQPSGLTDPNLRQGRRTAYYGAGVIPNIIMSKLGQPSPAESTMRQATNAYYNALGIQNPETEGLNRIAVDITGKPVPIGTPGSVVMDVKPTKGGGKELSPAAKPEKPEKPSDTAQFNQRLQKATELMDSGVDPDRVQIALENEFGSKIDAIDDFIFNWKSRKR